MVAVTNGRIAALTLTLVAATSHFSSTHSFSAISSSRVLAAARNGDARPTMTASVDAAAAVAAMERRRRRSGGPAPPPPLLHGTPPRSLLLRQRSRRRSDDAVAPPRRRRFGRDRPRRDRGGRGDDNDILGIGAFPDGMRTPGGPARVGGRRRGFELPRRGRSGVFFSVRQDSHRECWI